MTEHHSKPHNPRKINAALHYSIRLEQGRERHPSDQVLRS
ncbi:hypothetical protein GA0115260_116821, partial [Streptomyces sp. MnatMP-M27]